MDRCKICGKEQFLSFTCSYCGEIFCSEHRLPETHECTGLPERKWEAKPAPIKVKRIPVTGEPVSEKYLKRISDPNRKRPHEIAFEKDRRNRIILLVVLIAVILGLIILNELGYLDEILSVLRS